MGSVDPAIRGAHHLVIATAHSPAVLSRWEGWADDAGVRDRGRVHRAHRRRRDGRDSPRGRAGGDAVDRGGLRPASRRGGSVRHAGRSARTSRRCPKCSTSRRRASTRSTLPPSPQRSATPSSRREHRDLLLAAVDAPLNDGPGDGWRPTRSTALPSSGRAGRNGCIARSSRSPSPGRSPGRCRAIGQYDESVVAAIGRRRRRLDHATRRLFVDGSGSSEPTAVAGTGRRRGRCAPSAASPNHGTSITWSPCSGVHPAMLRRLSWPCADTVSRVAPRGVPRRGAPRAGPRVRQRGVGSTSTSPIVSPLTRHRDDPASDRRCELLDAPPLRRTRCEVAR